MRKTRHQQGISLLEVLFVLVIAATILAGAVMYFTQTMTSSRVSQASNLIQQINKAGDEWLQLPGSNDQYPGDFSKLTETMANGLDVFTQQALIPCENKSCYTDPWGGKVNVTVDDAYPQYMLITLSLLPQSDCARLQEQMKNIAPQGSTSDSTPKNQNACLGDSGTGPFTYSVYL